MDFRTLHVMMTLCLIFMNLMVAITYPDKVFLSDEVNPNVYDSNTGQYTFNQDYISEATSGLSEDPQSSVNEFGLFDALGAVWDIVKLVSGTMLALPVLILNLGLYPLFTAMYLTPVGLLYIFAFVGWFRW